MFTTWELAEEYQNKRDFCPLYVTSESDWRTPKEKKITVYRNKDASEIQLDDFPYVNSPDILWIFCLDDDDIHRSFIGISEYGTWAVGSTFFSEMSGWESGGDASLFTSLSAISEKYPYLTKYVYENQEFLKKLFPFLPFFLLHEKVTVKKEIKVERNNGTWREILFQQASSRHCTCDYCKFLLKDNDIRGEHRFSEEYEFFFHENQYAESRRDTLNRLIYTSDVEEKTISSHPVAKAWKEEIKKIPHVDLSILEQRFQMMFGSHWKTLREILQAEGLL